MPVRLPYLLIVLITLSIVTKSIEIRCYAGLKYVVGQEVIQDTENCDAILGMGESYCYKFMEETSLNEVVKMGCSSFFCNGIRNRCMETDLLGMKGKLCCCNDRHYCNSESLHFSIFFVFLLVTLLLWKSFFMKLSNIGCDKCCFNLSARINYFQYLKNLNIKNQCGTHNPKNCNLITTQCTDAVSN